MEHPGIPRPLELVRQRRNRNLRITLRPFQAIRVSAPPTLATKRIQVFLDSRRDWILKQLDVVRRKEALILGRVASLGPQSRSCIDRRLNEELRDLAAGLGVPLKRISYRNQSSRWGSCSARGSINLNRALILLPDHLRRYVMLHELVHLQHPNHGNRFWNALDKVYPGARSADRELSAYAIPPANLFLAELHQRIH